MITPIIGQISVFPYGFIPADWLPCNGQLMSVEEYDPLFQLIGTTYGGDGVSNFALPNLNARVPIGAGQGPDLPNVGLGQSGGTETAVLDINSMPAHTHPLSGGSLAVSTTPGTYVPAMVIDGLEAGVRMYGTAGGATLAANAMAPTGGSAPFSIRNPSLALLHCIAVFGEYPVFG